MPKKILSLGSEGKLVLKGPDGRIEDIPHPCRAYAFLVIDCSGSMEDGKLAQAKKGSLEFAEDAIKKGYSTGLIKFDSMAELLCKPEKEIKSLSHHVKGLMTGGSTNMAHGIQIAMESLSHTNGVRVMVVVTDGMPDDAIAALDAARQAKEKGIDVITIGTDDADKDFLSRLASRAELSVKVSRDQLGQSIASAVKMLPG
jgi:Mg-chelatase subunit ChlD